MDTLLSGLFADHSAAQRAVNELRRALGGEARIGVLLRRGAQSTMTTGTGAAGTTGMHVGGDDAALLGSLGATFVSANGRCLAGGVLADRMRDATEGNAVQALTAMGMRSEEAQQCLRRVEDGDILVIAEGIPQESPIRQVLAAAGAANLEQPPVRSQIRRHPADTPQTVEPPHVAEGPGTEATSLHHAKAHSAQRAAREKQGRATARREEVANMEAGEDLNNPSVRH